MFTTVKAVRSSFFLIAALCIHGIPLSQAASKMPLASQPVALAAVTIPHSKGRITFIDEAPNSETPRLSLSIVEDARYDTLTRLSQDQSVTPLEIYLAYAPKYAKINKRLQIDHDIRRAGDRKNPLRDWPLVAMPDSISGEGTADDWAEGCTNHGQWTAAFNDFVGFNFGSVTAHKIMSWHAPDSQFEYFGTTNMVWAGLCMQSGLMLHVRMEFQNFENDWVGVPGWAGSDMFIFPGQKYLYHSYTPNHLQSLRIVLSPFIDDEDEITVYLSGSRLTSEVSPIGISVLP